MLISYTLVETNEQDNHEDVGTSNCSTEFSNVKQNSNLFIKTKKISILLKQGVMVHVYKPSDGGWESGGAEVQLYP